MSMFALEGCFDLSLRKIPGPRRTFILSGEISNPSSSVEEATESFARRVGKIDSQLPGVLPSVFDGAVLDCDFNGTNFSDIDFSQFPDFFREAIRDPRYPTEPYLASEKPSRIDLITYWSLNWADMQLDIFFADRPSWGRRDLYELEFKPEVGLHLSNSGGSEVIIRNKRLTQELNPSKISAQERLETARFSNQLLDVIDMLLQGAISNHRIEQRKWHASRTA